MVLVLVTFEHTTAGRRIPTNRRHARFDQRLERADLG
jgi:hypothetical protein